ncbi:MAG: hypothetical protein ACRCTZ_16510 [Sarcina sp.]
MEMVMIATNKKYIADYRVLLWDNIGRRGVSCGSVKCLSDSEKCKTCILGNDETYSMRDLKVNGRVKYID